VVNWNSVPVGSSSDLQVSVQCYHEDGVMDDVSFYVIVIE
jgi:hypothetical protein